MGEWMCWECGENVGDLDGMFAHSRTRHRGASPSTAQVIFRDIRAMGLDYWRYAADAAVHSIPWKWIIPYVCRRKVCDWYDDWLNRRQEG